MSNQIYSAASGASATSDLISGVTLNPPFYRLFRRHVRRANVLEVVAATCFNSQHLRRFSVQTFPLLAPHRTTSKTSRVRAAGLLLYDLPVF